MRYRNAIAALAALLAFAAPARASRLASASYVDVNGVYGFGSSAGVSPNYIGSASMQEVVSSTQQSNSFSGRDGRLSFHPFPATVADLSVVIVSSSGIKAQWTAPSADISRDAGPADAYILRYSSAGYISTDAAFRSAHTYAQNWTPMEPGTEESAVVYGFEAGTTYYFAIETINSHSLRSELSNPVAAFALLPLAPMNFKVTRSGNSVTMTWIPPAGYENRIAFNDRFSPAYPFEVKGYQVYRATAPADADWEFLAEVSSTTLQWTDAIAAGENYYYHARAVNQAGESRPSYARSSLSGDLYFLAPDNQSILEVPADGTGSFFSSSSDPMEAYSIEITTRAADIVGRVVKSVEFTAYRGGLVEDDSFRLSKNGKLKLFYSKSGSSIVPSSSDEKAVSMFYHNGSRWLQMYGTVDPAERSVSLETTLLGRYQLRTTERSGGFSADSSGLTNRLITPNGDGKNDTMVFIFDNPQDASVKGRIYDMRGALVAQMREGPVSNSLLWDGKAGGQAVPGGVYIYQLECGGKVYNGTVVVVR